MVALSVVLEALVPGGVVLDEGRVVVVAVVRVVGGAALAWP